MIIVCIWECWEVTAGKNTWLVLEHSIFSLGKAYVNFTVFSHLRSLNIQDNKAVAFVFFLGGGEHWAKINSQKVVVHIR